MSSEGIMTRNPVMMYNCHFSSQTLISGLNSIITYLVRVKAEYFNFTNFKFSY